MQFPMIGNWSVRITDVRSFSIHADVYYEIQADRLDDGSNTAMTLRVPQHATASLPVAGQNATVTFLLGQVTCVHLNAE
jgi:hypothetical protein